MQNLHRMPSMIAKKNKTWIDYKKMPLSLAQDVRRTEQLLDSQTSTVNISKYSGINHSTIYRLRNGNRKMNALTLKTFYALANYPESNIKHLRFFKMSYRFDRILTLFPNISKLSRDIEVSRATLERIRNGQLSLGDLNIISASHILRFWDVIQEARHAHCWKLIYYAMHIRKTYPLDKIEDRVHTIVQNHLKHKDAYNLVIAKQ